MKERSDVELFVEWAESSGVDFKGIEVRSAGEGAGNGVYATQSFRTDEYLIKLPRDLMITAGKVADMPAYRTILQKFDAKPTPFEMLTIFFCLEEPSTSKWAPYLRVLPEEFTTPAAEDKVYSPDEVPLSGRAFYDLQLNELKGVWGTIKKMLGDRVSRKRFLWAWHVVNTRCIYVENPDLPLLDCSQGDTIAVIPFVDMLNHSPTAQGFAFYDKVHDVYCVRATRGVAEGDEIFVCYGPHDNVRLWFEYGFRLIDNPNGRVFLPQELLIALARKAGLTVTDDHIKALNESGQPSTIYATDEGPSWSLQSNMRILHMNREQVLRWREIVYADCEKRRRRRVSDSSSDSEENVEKSEDVKREQAEMRTLAMMLEELAESVRNKREKVHDELKWAWDEQIAIINTTKKAISL